MKRTVALIILDGYGIGKNEPTNAVLGAKKPNLDRIFASNPSTSISASGLDVGLPEGQMGNSEVGHLNIGAGRIVYQELTRISKAIEDGDFFENKEFLGAIDFVKENRRRSEACGESPNNKLHLFGLFSDGGVHSHIEHLYALLKLAKHRGLDEVYVHAFTDGRDTSTTGGLGYLREFEQKAKEIGIGRIASVSGRYYAMDRDKRWERIEKTYRMMTEGMTENSAANGASCPAASCTADSCKSAFSPAASRMDVNVSCSAVSRMNADACCNESSCFESAAEIFETSYAAGVTDEFIVPTAVCRNGQPIALVQDGDAVIFYNFRPDRARQISRAFLDEHFEGFERRKLNLRYVGMTQYDASIEGIHTAYLPETLVNTLGEYASKLGMKQLRIAETEKYAHVTFFFGGGVEQPYDGEERILVNSPKVATYDLQPEMSAFEVADKLVEQIEKDRFDIIICNFANPDMVGHTGVYEAAVKAIEAVDDCIGRVAEALEKIGAGYIITADHGNSECMANPDGTPMTAHTTNLVPLVIGGCGDLSLREGGVLSDIAPTILDLMRIDQPVEMTGKSLIRKQNTPLLSCGIECPVR